MALAVFHGAMRPNRGLLGSDGRCLMDVRHVVEFRCGRALQRGSWVDVWQAYGTSFSRAEMANQEAEKLRADGHTVRVRPVIV